LQATVTDCRKAWALEEKKVKTKVQNLLAKVAIESAQVSYHQCAGIPSLAIDQAVNHSQSSINCQQSSFHKINTISAEHPTRLYSRQIGSFCFPQPDL